MKKTDCWAALHLNCDVTRSKIESGIHGKGNQVHLGGSPVTESRSICALMGTPAELSVLWSQGSNVTWSLLNTDAQAIMQPQNICKAQWQLEPSHLPMRDLDTPVQAILYHWLIATNRIVACKTNYRRVMVGWITFDVIMAPVKSDLSYCSYPVYKVITIRENCH